MPIENNIQNVCDLNYLNEMMGGKKLLIREIMDAFLEQIQEELKSIKDAIERTDFLIIKKFSHTMRSSVSIMGISVLTPILQEMENLGTAGVNIEKIKELNGQLVLICKQAVREIENEKLNCA